MIIILICNKQRRKIVILIHNFWLITCTTKNWSLLNCVPKCPRANVLYVLTWSHANVPCVLTCQCALRAYVLTCQRVSGTCCAHC